MLKTTVIAAVGLFCLALIANVSSDAAWNALFAKANGTCIGQLLGKETGQIETNDEMVTLLHSLLDTDWPDLVIEASGSDAVVIKSDPDKDRKFGGDTKMGFDKIRVSIEPLAALSFMKIDIAKRPEMIDSYLDYLEVVSQNVTTAASVLGSLQTRMELQTEFSSRLIQSLDKGVGLLVDGDMEEAAGRLSALQTQQQLALQSLSIANSSSEGVLSLFR
jgi:flagellin